MFDNVEKTSAECVMKTRVFGNFTSLKSRTALQVAREIAPCNMALSVTKINLEDKIFQYLYISYI